jgi:3-oxoacyl-[acyl-carrier protein] reductase
MNKFDFNDRTAVITGGGQGFGLDIAKRFLNSGAKVFIWDIDEDLLKSAVKEVNHSNLNYNVIDVSNYSQIEKTVSDITSQNKIDILINNAGITGPTAPLWEYDVEMWNKIVKINLVGTFNCCRAIVPNMIKNNYGRIVNVASVAGKDGNANASAYSSGKAGAKTRILNQMSKEHVQRMLSKVPRGRFLEIHEFTSLICWLSSEENTFSTAAVFDISGGRSTY